MAIKVNLKDVEFKPHPKFEGVEIAFVTTKDSTPQMSLTLLKIAPGIEVPIHTHENEVDSIFVIKGRGKAFLNGEWKDLEEGDIVVIPPKDEHGVRSETELVCYIIHAPALW